MLKDIVKNLEASSTLKINEISRELEEKGNKIFKFGFGQSPFQVPDDIVNELKVNAHQNKYLPMQGLLNLRKSIAKYTSEIFIEEGSDIKNSLLTELKTDDFLKQIDLLIVFGGDGTLLGSARNISCQARTWNSRWRRLVGLGSVFTCFAQMCICFIYVQCISL